MKTDLHALASVNSGLHPNDPVLTGDEIPLVGRIDLHSRDDGQVIQNREYHRRQGDYKDGRSDAEIHIQMDQTGFPCRQQALLLTFL
ncbi:hypothetical protein D3C73_1432530 [compost metagenome]